MHLEGTDGVLIVSRDKRYYWEVPRIDLLKDRKSIDFRHLDVQHQQIRQKLGNGCKGLVAVRALGNKFEIRICGQHAPQNGTGSRFVVDNYCPPRSIARWLVFFRHRTANKATQ